MISLINLSTGELRELNEKKPGDDTVSNKISDYTKQISELQKVMGNINLSNEQLIKAMSDAALKIKWTDDMKKGNNILSILNSNKAYMNSISAIASSLPKLDLSSTEYIKSIGALTSSLPKVDMNPNWVLSNAVLKQMSLIGRELEAKKIFSKIPRSNYDLHSSGTQNGDEIEYVIENKKTKKTIPVREVGNSLAVTDIIDTLTPDDMFSFYDHLVQYPMLGLEHEVGRKIFNEIKKVPLKAFENQRVYRARGRYAKENEIPFTEVQMFEAPYGLAGHGRFNVVGQGELYVCSDREVALKEIASDDEGYLYDIIAWELTEQVHLLDLSSYDSPLAVYSAQRNSSPNKKEYLIPNFLSQCLKYHKVTGIRFNSVVDKEEYNYVFFDFENRWFNKVNFEYDIKYNHELQASVK